MIEKLNGYSGRIEQILSHGESSAISMKELTSLMGFRNSRALRARIEHERENGCIILSSNSGYFLPSEDTETAISEIRRYVATCDARLRSNRRAIRAAKRYLKAVDAEAETEQISLFA